MRPKKTDRGFYRADFEDENGASCSIQESSAAFHPCIWLGLNEGTHHLGKCLARMHLTKRLAKQLLPLLAKFVETGKLK